MERIKRCKSCLNELDGDEISQYGNKCHNCVLEDDGIEG